MLNLQQMQEIVNTQNALFLKPNCPFCTATLKLGDSLVNQKILASYSLYTLNIDFDNETLTKLVAKNGWQPDGAQHIASKPQIFIQGQYIGGNFEFYKSQWNLSANMPNLNNPMKF